MRYSGSGFYEYHKQFSAKAVACLQQHQGWTNKPYDRLVCLKVTQNYSREPVFHSPENGQQNIMYCRSSCVQKFNYCTNLELTSKQTSWTYRAQFIRHVTLFWWGLKLNNEILGNTSRYCRIFVILSSAPTRFSPNCDNSGEFNNSGKFIKVILLSDFCKILIYVNYLTGEILYVIRDMEETPCLSFSK